MKKFQFRLDTVLNYKQQVLDSLQNEYSLLLQQVQQQKDLLNQSQKKYTDLNQEFRQVEAEGITIAEALRYENGLRFLEQEIQKEEKLLQQYQNRAEEKRLQVVAARQDMMSLEKLKDKKRRDYQKDLQKQEEQFMDELASTKKVMASGTF